MRESIEAAKVKHREGVLKGKLNSHSAGRSQEDEMFTVVSKWQLS